MFRDFRRNVTKSKKNELKIVDTASLNIRITENEGGKDKTRQMTEA